MHDSAHSEALRSELHRVLASEEFRRSHALARLLSYLGERVLAGDAAGLKEVLLGHALYDRPLDYDPQFDSVVRVNANRLRGRLEDYYRVRPGSAFHLVLPKGSYLLQLEVCDVQQQAPAASAPRLLNADVSEGTELSDGEIASASEEPSTVLWVDRVHGKPFPQTAFLLASVVGVALCFLFWRLAHRPAAVAAGTSWSVRPFARQGGSQQFGSFSPDGKSLVFASTSTGNWTKAIYVQSVGGDEARKLADGTRPSWSPDGKRVAFLRLEGDGKKKVIAYTLATQSESVVAEIEGGILWLCSQPHLSWSPDSKTIYTSASLHHEPMCSVVAIDVDTHSVRGLSKPTNSTGDLEAAVSPDGTQVAFLRGQGFGSSDIYVTDLESGRTRQVTNDKSDIIGFAWKEDGSGFVLASNRDGGTRRLWQASLDGAAMQALTDGSSAPTFPAVSCRGECISFTQFRVISPIWRVSAKKVVEVLDNQSANESPDVSPDGQKLLYTSNRAGHGYVWLSQIDGTSSRKLVRDDAYETGSGRWSPDGRHIALECKRNGPTHICLADADGGGVHELTNGASNEVLPSWSRDGKFVYYTLRASGQQQIYRRDMISGEAVPMTTNGGYRALESWDGKWLYVSRGQPLGGFVVLPTNGGTQDWRAAENKPVLLELGSDTGQDWGIAREGVVYRSNEEKGQLQLKVFDMLTHRSKIFCPLGGFDAGLDLTMNVMPDGESIIFSGASTHSELNMMWRTPVHSTTLAEKQESFLRNADQ